MLVTSSYATTLVPLLPPSTSPHRHPPPQPPHFVEFCATSSSAGEASAFIEGVSRAPVRVYFSRHEEESKVRGTEAVAAFVSVDGMQAWVKVYATGEGISGGPHNWFVDTSLGGAVFFLLKSPLRSSLVSERPVDLALHPTEVEDKKVRLRVCACKLRSGIDLGTGHLLLSDVSYIEEKDPIAVFTWFYCSRAHLDFFGIAAGPPLDPLPSPTESALSFLRHSTQILLSLLAPEQRLTFLDELSIDIGTLALLPETAKAELETFREAGRADANAHLGVHGGEEELRGGMQDDSGMWEEGGIENLLREQVAGEQAGVAVDKTVDIPSVLGSGEKRTHVEGHACGSKAVKNDFSLRQPAEETQEQLGEMFSAHGFSLQLILAGNPIFPTSFSTIDDSNTSVSYAVASSLLVNETPWVLQWRDDRPSTEAGPAVGSVFSQAGEEETQGLIGTVKSKPGDETQPSIQGELEGAHSRVTFTLVIEGASTALRKNTPRLVFTLVVSDSALPWSADSPVGVNASIASYSSHPSPESPQASPGLPRPSMVEISAAEYLKLQRDVNIANRKAEAAHSVTHTLFSTVPLSARIAALDKDLRSGHVQTPPMSPEKRFQQGKQIFALMQELQAQTAEYVKKELIGVVQGVLSVTGRNTS
ncbi:hypothetical protein JCM11251_004257 [Rhodosporidiobolus azoricus]